MTVLAVKESTEKLYDASAGGWVRDEPVLLSDFTARPVVFEWCAPLEGARVLDLGCGEGYVARRLAEQGAASVLGLDQSSGMVANAQHAAEDERFAGRLQFRVADAGRALEGIEAGSFDLTVAVFLMNYLDIEATHQVMRSAFEASAVECPAYVRKSQGRSFCGCVTAMPQTIEQ